MSSITCVLSPLFGMHVGHLFLEFNEIKVRSYHLLIISVIEIVMAILLDYTEIQRFNTDLYSISYLLMTSGLATLLILFLYLTVDVLFEKYRQQFHGNYRPKQHYQIIKDEQKHSKSHNFSSNIDSQLISPGNNFITPSNTNPIDLDTSDSIHNYYDDINNCPSWCCCCCFMCRINKIHYPCKYIIDILLIYPFQCVGRNAIGIFLLSEGGIISYPLSTFYINNNPDSNLVNILYPTGIYWGPTTLNGNNGYPTNMYSYIDPDWHYSGKIMLYVIFYCLFFIILAIYFDKKKWYYVV